MDAQEQYIYLGKQQDTGKKQDTLFFLHTVNNPKHFNKCISHQIMDYAIHKSLIVNFNQRCIILEIFPVQAEINAIIISQSRGEFYVYDKEILEHRLLQIINSERNHDNLIITYDYHKRSFYSHINSLPCAKWSLRELTLNNIVYVETTNSFLEKSLNSSRSSFKN